LVSSVSLTSESRVSSTCCPRSVSLFILKARLFIKSLTLLSSQTSLSNAANFPYATIDPEEARILVPDERHDWLCETYKPASRIAAYLTCIDIAGLTAGASTGAGLGNAFLSHVRAVDGIFQMVRAFDDAEVIHVEGDVDPTRDMTIIQTELRLKDIEWTEKTIEALKRGMRGSGANSLAEKAKKEELATVEKVLATMKDENKDVRKGVWTSKEVSVGSCFSCVWLLSRPHRTFQTPLFTPFYLMRKGANTMPDLTQLVDLGVTPRI
jgi:ribosome-binding ATPase YchF (GTP1/OBG family)